METVSKSWALYSKSICECPNCQRDHKASFYAGANAFMWNMQNLPAGKDGAVDIGNYIDAQHREFSAHFAECAAENSKTAQHH